MWMLPFWKKQPQNILKYRDMTIKLQGMLLIATYALLSITGVSGEAPVMHTPGARSTSTLRT